MGIEGGGELTEKAAWFAELAGSLPGLEVYGLGVVVVDLADGRIVGATETGVGQLGGGSPSSMRDLLERGTVARPDLHRFREALARLRAASDPDEPETSHSWSDDVRIHPAGSPSTLVHVEVVVHRRPALDAEAAVVTIWPAEDRRPVEGRARGVVDEVWTIYDDQLRSLAADPRLEDLGIDPASQIGANAWMYVHPRDVPAAQPLVNELLQGRRRELTYSARVRASDGRWLVANIDVRRLVGADGPIILVHSRYDDLARVSIEPGALTPREEAVVCALFDGLRVSQIAERDHIAVKTVRHQLASVYRKLHVTGQIELLDTYHRPASAS